MEITFERRIRALPETVFAFFTDEEKYAKWMGVEASLDPVPGGEFRVVNPDGVVTRGVFVDLDPPRRLVLTWGFEGHPHVPEGSSTVTVTLEEADGETLLRLVHSGLPDEHWATMHEQGWHKYLERLKICATGGDPGPDQR